jgi:type II secretory pathway pseudopilin PulG
MAIRAVVLLLLLGLLGIVVLGIVAVSSLLSVPNQVAGGLGQRLNGATAGAAQAVASAQQAVQDATDPNHPPSGLVYDTEFSSLQVWHTGDRLPDSTDYTFTVQSIERRQGASSPDTALYAVIHAELRQPRQTRLLGQVIRSDSDPHDYALYKGESFRIGRTLYRVNWVSQADGALAAGVYKNPDSVSASLKFAYD